MSRMVNPGHAIIELCVAGFQTDGGHIVRQGRFQVTRVFRGFAKKIVVIGILVPVLLYLLLPGPGPRNIAADTIEHRQVVHR